MKDFLKNIILSISVSFLAMGFTHVVAAYEKDEKKTEAKKIITVNQYVNHVALDSAYDGLKQSLIDGGYLPDKMEIIHGNAQGNISNSVQISKYHASLNPDFMVAIATPSVQTNLKARSADKSNDIVLAFLAVTDPSAANLDEQPGVIGVTDSPPIEELIAITKNIFNDLKTIGVLYNTGEINSVKIVAELQRIATVSNIEIKTATVSNTSDIKGALAKLSGEVDIIYLPQDNTVISALDNVVAITKKHKLPVIANDPTLVERGVTLALGANYYNSGFQLGNMIIDCIEGKELSAMIQSTNVSELKINQAMIELFGIEVPKSILQDERLVK